MQQSGLVSSSDVSCTDNRKIIYTLKPLRNFSKCHRCKNDLSIIRTLTSSFASVRSRFVLLWWFPTEQHMKQRRIKACRVIVTSKFRKWRSCSRKSFQGVTFLPKWILKATFFIFLIVAGKGYFFFYFQLNYCYTWVGHQGNMISESGPVLLGLVVLGSQLMLHLS